MHKIKCLVKDMHGELDAAERYTRHALKFKEEDKELAETYARVARQELEHCELYHTQAVRVIREYNKEPPEAMQAVWDFEHERIMERTAKIKVELQMYNSMS